MERGRNIEIIVRQYLRDHGLDVSAFAKKIGVTRVTIYNAFRGKLSLKLLKRLSIALSVPESVLVGGTQPHQDRADHTLLEKYYAASTKSKAIVDLALGINTVDPIRTSRPTVLVVDDIEDNVQLLHRCLRKDYNVIVFTKPDDALRAAQEQPVDAVITDQRMPGMTGTQLLAELEEIGLHPVKIIVSAYSDNEALMEAINESKADRFILKPFRPTDLCRQLQRHLEILNHQRVGLH